MRADLDGAEVALALLRDYLDRINPGTPDAADQLQGLINAWDETQTLPLAMAPVLAAYRAGLVELAAKPLEWVSCMAPLGVVYTRIKEFDAARQVIEEVGARQRASAQIPDSYLGHTLINAARTGFPREPLAQRLIDSLS